MRSCQAPPFLKYGWRLNPSPPAERRDVGDHYDNSLFPSCDTHRPNLYYLKISQRKFKIVYAISSGTGKNRTYQTVSSTLHLEGQARYFTALDRHNIKLDKNKMDSKFMKSQQCSLLERYHAVFWLKLILNSDQELLDKNRFLQVY